MCIRPLYAALTTLALSGSAVIAAPPAAAPSAPPLPPEQLTTTVLGPAAPHWIYVLDEAFANEIDARIYLFDGDSHRRLGQIDAGFDPGFNLSPDGRTTVVATTYFARGGHGARTDVVEFTDNSTLGVTHEIVLPPKRAQTLPTYFNVGYSADSRFVYVAYVVPAASFGVLDPVHGKVLSEIDTAGCMLVIPSGPNRVSSICESGRLLTVTLDAGGHERSRTLSAPFFDVDTDPVFAQGVPSRKGVLFLSFLGQVHEVDLTGAQPAIGAPWWLLTAAERGHWRPGGYQVGAIHRALGKLYVPMHQGGEGTHKDGGTEVWVYDLASHRRVARWPVPPDGDGRAIAVQVSQDSRPLVFLALDNSDVEVLDAATGRLEHIEKHLGETPWVLMNP